MRPLWLHVASGHSDERWGGGRLNDPFILPPQLMNRQSLAFPVTGGKGQHQSHSDVIIYVSIFFLNLILDTE